MVPLFGCSVAVCVVFIERILAYRGWIVKNEQFLLAFSNHWLKGDKEGARNLTEKSTTELSEIARIVTSPRGDAARVPAQVERKRQELAVEMRRFLWVLGTIGSSAPFIGLFGTVVGIIESFQNMAQTGSGGFSVVAAGISQALVATAGGIVVAVVSVFFYNYFQVKVARLQFQLKLYTEELLDLYGR